MSRPDADIIGPMRLRHARLCLDCEEIHAASHCPVCASESFAYVSRWIPPGATRTEARPSGIAAHPSTTAANPEIDAAAGSLPRKPKRRRWVRRGAAGVALIALTRVLWEASRPVDWSSEPGPVDSEAEPDPSESP